MYHSFEAIEDAKERELTFKEAYGWIKENSSEEYDLPNFDTWKRYISKVREFYETQRTIPRHGRKGGSTVSSKEI